MPLDVPKLDDIRSGWLYKLGGGTDKGSKWNKRFFVLRDNVMMYFNAEKDFQGFRDKPSGVVLVEDAAVDRSDASTDEKSKEPKYAFSLTHPQGETLVLAASTEILRAEWMEHIKLRKISYLQEMTAMQQSKQVEADNERIQAEEKLSEQSYDRSQLEGIRADAASDLQQAKQSLADSQLAKKQLQKELGAVTKQHADVMAAKQKAERDLREILARFKLRKSLLHWRQRTLSQAFRMLIGIVYQEKLSTALTQKSEAEALNMDAKRELELAQEAREEAETARKTVEAALQEQILLQKQAEQEAAECERALKAEIEAQEEAEQEKARLDAEIAEHSAAQQAAEDATIKAREELKRATKEEMARLDAMIKDLRKETDSLKSQLVVQ